MCSRLSAAFKTTWRLDLSTLTSLTSSPILKLSSTTRSKLKILAGGPQFYPDLVNLNVIPSIVSLLSHDNTDIAIDAFGLLQDLTDEDELEDNDEPAQVLVYALVKNNVVELLVQNLHRLSDSDPDEGNAAYSTLATIENLIEVKPAVPEISCEKTKLLRWLLGR